MRLTWILFIIPRLCLSDRVQGALDVDELLSGDEDAAEEEVLKELIANKKLNDSFLRLARELDILEPKTPDDIYKTHLETASRKCQRRAYHAWDEGRGQVLIKRIDFTLLE